MGCESLHVLGGLLAARGDPGGLSALSYRDLCTPLQGER
jgi:hypothetical protein